MGERGSVLGRAAWKMVVGTAVAAGLLIAVAPIASILRPHGAQASRQAADDDPPKAGADTHEARPGIVRLGVDSQRQGGIVAVTPRATRYHETIRGFGVVLALDKLTALYNASLTNEAQERAAEAKVAASRTANARSQELLKIFQTARAQAEAAAAAYEMDAIAVETAKAQVQALRNTALQDWGALLGEAIVSRSALATDLVRRKTCLILLSLPTDSAHPPRTVTFDLDGGASAAGRFLSEAAQVDPRFQGVGLLYAADAVPGLVPGRSVLALVPEGDEKPGVEVPPSAVVWQSGKPWIYLRTANDRFERRPIADSAAPTPDGGYIMPSQRFENGALVIAGAQVLLSQELREQIPSDEDD